MENVGLNMAAVIASNSFYVGGDWGFVLNSNKEYKEIYDILRQSGEMVEVIELENGIIVRCNPQYLYQTVSRVEEIDKGVLDLQNQRTAYETQEFQKFLTQILRNDSKYAKPAPNMRGAYVYTFAIYSCNNMHKLRLNGVEYPAYSLTVAETLKELLKLSKHKDMSIISNYGKFLNVGDLIANGSVKDLVDILEISDTLTGVFVKIIVRDK